MKLIGKKILTTITTIFIVLFIWIVINAIFLGQEVIFKYNSALLILSIIIYISLTVILYKKIIPILAKYKYLHLALFTIFGLIAIVVSYKIRVNPSWDMGRIFNIAQTYVKEGYVSDVYLYEYQNNIAITCIYILFFEFFKIMNITKEVVAITIMNALIVTCAVIFLYYAVREMFNKEKAMMVLIICIFTTPFYLYSAIYYSDSLSMFFSTLLLLLYVLIRKQNNKTINILLQILWGISIVVGIKVKIASFFIIIAIVLWELLNGNFKELFNNFKVTLPIALIFYLIYTLVVNTYVIPKKDTLNYCKMPIEHWILLGLDGPGGFNQELYEYTKGYKTYEERKNADIIKIKEKIKEYNIISFIAHINEKLKFTWADGTYFASDKISREPVSRNTLTEIFANNGKYANFYKYFPQTMHLGMLVFMVVNVVFILKKQNYNIDDVFLFISIFGLAVFFMIWENRSRYILTLVPIMIVLEVNGIEQLSNKIKNVFKSNKERD